MLQRQATVITDADTAIAADPMSIIYDYLGTTPLYGPTLFKALSELYQAEATLAVHYLLMGDTVTVEAMVEDNPAILYYEIEAFDRRRNKVRGTLLQIAALTGDTNLRAVGITEKDHGMVERLKAYLPDDVAIKQLQATRPFGWERETAVRMRPYENAIKDFLTDILTTPIDDDANYGGFKTACYPHITKFLARLELIPDLQPVITTGLIFDPQIFVTTLEDLFEKTFGLSWDEKSDLFASVGYGSLQACASVFDLQALQASLDGCIMYGKLPDRSFHFASGVPQSHVGLGDSFYIGILGGSVRMGSCGLVAISKRLRDLCASKNNIVAICYPTQRQPYDYDHPWSFINHTLWSSNESKESWVRENETIFLRDEPADDVLSTLHNLPSGREHCRYPDRS